MSIQEVFAEVRRFSFEERLELLALLSQTIYNEGKPSAHIGSSVDRVRGLLKPDGPMPTDAELLDAYSNHLIEKHT